MLLKRITPTIDMEDSLRAGEIVETPAGEIGVLKYDVSTGRFVVRFQRGRWSDFPTQGWEEHYEILQRHYDFIGIKGNVKTR